MIYPIQIDNEPQLLRIIKEIAKEVVKELQPEKKLALMSKNDCYKALGGRSLIDKAIKSGKLKLHCIEGRVCIKTKEFDEWLSKG
ncbi:MAG TPA: hypothetical protein VFC67_02830 [Prolixibacteraceae bacterium]|nr:hypothetical protein [Prolixibacteraceae bacterium]